MSAPGAGGPARSPPGLFLLPTGRPCRGSWTGLCRGRGLCTDDHSTCAGIEGFDHKTVNHSHGEHVGDGKIHTNGIELFRPMFRRGYRGICHKMSPGHPDRHVDESRHRQNIRERDRLAQMTHCIPGMDGRRLTCRALIADNGLDGGARAG